MQGCSTDSGPARRPAAGALSPVGVIRRLGRDAGRLQYTKTGSRCMYAASIYACTASSGRRRVPVRSSTRSLRPVQVIHAAARQAHEMLRTCPAPENGVHVRVHRLQPPVTSSRALVYDARATASRVHVGGPGFTVSVTGRRRCSTRCTRCLTRTHLSNLRRVVPSMPCIQGGDPLQRDQPLVLGVEAGAREIFIV